MTKLEMSAYQRRRRFEMGQPASPTFERNVLAGWLSGALSEGQAATMLRLDRIGLCELRDASIKAAELQWYYINSKKRKRELREQLKAEKPTVESVFEAKK